MDKLKPCPFCGGKAVFNGQMHNIEDGNAQQTVFTISCSKCHTSLPTTYGSIQYRFSGNGNLSIYHDDRDKAVREWNKRISESDAAERREEGEQE